MGWLSSPSYPSPPPAPTPTEIGAANAETAEHLSRLQRAMQFGEPMLRKGFKEDSGKYYDAAGGEVLPSEAIEVDFTGRGDTDLARKEWEFQQEMSPLQAEFMLEQAREFGPQFTEESRKLVEASDPTGYAAREMAGQKAMDYEPETLPEGPMLEGITEDVVIEDSPETTANHTPCSTPTPSASLHSCFPSDDLFLSAGILEGGEQKQPQGWGGGGGRVVSLAG